MDLFGSFQSERYFLPCADLIRDIFAPQSGHPPKQEGVCSLHVRRGDYLKRGTHRPLTLDYYERGMEQFPGYCFLVFSDDIDWCRSVFTGRQFDFAEHYPDYMDLSLMSACEHHIIANSTFSWWAAWLDSSLCKRVVAPHHGRWFGPALRMHDTRDLFPGTWQLF